MKPIAAGFLAMALLIAAGEETIKVPPAGPLAPYMVIHENGAYMDWLDGHVGVRGVTRISRRINLNRVFYLQTRTAAEMQGHERMKDLLAGTPIDGRALLGADEALKTRVSERVGIQKAEEIIRDSGPIFEVLVKTPLWGPDSLIHLVLGEPAMERRAAPAITTAGLSAASAETGPSGLIIDARELQDPAAAFLPRILDEAGHLIHGVESADPVALRERGLVAYVVCPSGVNPQSGGQRQGDRPMMVKAVSAAGVTRADLVIRQGDAERIAASPSTLAALRECRVIILMKPPPLQAPRPAPRSKKGTEQKPNPIDPNLN